MPCQVFNFKHNHCRRFAFEGRARAILSSFPLTRAIVEQSRAHRDGSASGETEAFDSRFQELLRSWRRQSSAAAIFELDAKSMLRANADWRTSRTALTTARLM